MKITIIFECDMTGWANREDFDQMSDAEIEELAREDLTELFNNAKVQIVREP